MTPGDFDESEPTAGELFESDASAILMRIDEDWHDEFFAGYEPDKWLNGYRALGSFIGEKVRVLRTPPTARPVGGGLDLTPFDVRGFTGYHFTDRYGERCSVQESSLATEAALWLGIDSPVPKQLVPNEGWQPIPMPPGEVLIAGRMHLTQAQVAALLPLLQEFAAHGSLPERAALPQPPQPVGAHLCARALCLTNVASAGDVCADCADNESAADWQWLERMGFMRFRNADGLDTWAFGLAHVNGTTSVNIEVWGPTTLLEAVRVARARIADDALPTPPAPDAAP